MAYDPEARKDSNTALIAGVAALILVIAAVAYFATRQPEVAEVPTTTDTVVIQTEATPVTNTVIQEVPVEAPTTAPPTVIVQPPDRVIERNTTTTTNRVIVATPVPNEGGDDSEGAPNGAAGTRSSTNTNVTVNVPPQNAAPATGPTRAPAARDNNRNNGGVNVEGNAGNPAPAPRDSGY